MKKSTRNFLYFLFSLIIIASAIVLVLGYFKEPDIPEIYEPTPSEITVEEEEKVNQIVESKVISMAPDIDLNQARIDNKNNDIIGRLEIPDLINVLVVKGTDNSFYLQHAVNRSYDIRGSEFLDYTLTPTSQQINIYGHNSRDPKIKVAFIKLENFLNKEFFDNNQYIIFQHDNGKNIYKIKSIKEVYESNNEHMKFGLTGDDFVNHFNLMTSGEGLINSRPVNFESTSNIIVLQTCSHHWNKALYLVVGVRIK